MAVFFIAALIRVWLLRRQEEKLLKKIDSYEKQILTLQKDLMTNRQDANTWRAEMQRQFDLFRSTASQHIEVEQKRFNDLLSKSRDREHQLQTSLDIAKQMCSELPATKARLMQMESLMALDAGEALSHKVTPVALPASASKLALSPVPDLDGTPLESLPEMPLAAATEGELAAAESPAPSDDVQAKLHHLQQQNQQLQQALTASRLRARLRPRSTARGRNGKN